MTKLEEDPRFNFGPPKIQTAEDAVMAFLREEITEDEFRDACGRYGVLPGSLFNQRAAKPERIDAAYETTIPDDLFSPEENPEDNLENRLKGVDDKEKAREKALKENPPVVSQVGPGVTPVHEVGGVKTTEVKENEKLPKAQTASTK